MDTRLELRNGGLQAVAVLGDDRADTAALARFLREQFASLGAKDLPSETDLRHALDGATPDQTEVVVAHGSEPQPGINAQLIPFFPSRETPLDEGADPFAAFPQNVVYPGDDVLRKTPASEGIPGRSLLGTSIPARHGTDLPVIPGDGILKAEAGLLFQSSTYGIVLFGQGRLWVADAVTLSEDRMEARVTVLPDVRKTEEAHLERLLKALDQLGVRQGIKRDALAEAVRRARESGRPVPSVLAAEGRLPEDGQEPDCRLLVDLEKKAGTITEGDRMDFRELGTVKNVAKGEVLAEVVVGRPAVPGYRLDGSVLAPRMRRAEGLKPGDRTVLSADGTQVLADADGMIVVRGGKFHIDDEFLVPADVDLTTGNIHASGSVRVKGQVTAGFSVKAGKTVEVYGDVWEAVVEAGGELKVRGAITAGSRVKAGGNVTARFIQNSRVETEGDLDVALSITASEVYVRGKLRAVGAQGILLGGEVNATMGIEARTVGSPSARTRIAIGVDLRLSRELEAIQKLVPEIQDELRSLQGNLGREFLKDPRAALLALPPALRKPKIDVLQRMKNLQQRGQELTARRDELTALLAEERDASLSVLGEIHAGTAVTIGKARTTLSETLRRVMLHVDSERNAVVWRHL